MQATTSVSEINPDSYKILQDHVYSQVGIVLEHDKHYLFESRLTPIVRQMGLRSINELCRLIVANRDSEVSRNVVEAMTTNETYFFREPAHYEAIRTVLLPRLDRERQATRQMRIWSAASSSGQEAYSMAMRLLEEGYANWNIEILGTDFTGSVLDRARAGRYQQIEVNRGLPAPLLLRYFQRAGVDWQLCDLVRRMVRFEQIDLRNPMRGLGPFDLVFCRNVLIYFDGPTKKNIMREIRRTLSPGGWLLLGGAETAVGVEEWFDKQNVGGVTVYVAR
jgi:chemotaxis protein methyltransferase CheR